MKFSSLLIVKLSNAKTMKEFPFYEVPFHENLGVNVGRDDIIQDFFLAEAMTINGDIP